MRLRVNAGVPLRVNAGACTRNEGTCHANQGTGTPTFVWAACTGTPRLRVLRLRVLRLCVQVHLRLGERLHDKYTYALARTGAPPITTGTLTYIYV